MAASTDERPASWHRNLLRLHLLTTFFTGGTPAWFADRQLLAVLARALADLHRVPRPTVVAGIERSALPIGEAVAQQLGVPFAAIRKQPQGRRPRPGLLWCRTRRDYDDQRVVLTLPRGHITYRDRVLLVDDWLVTGAQAEAARALAADAGASWIGVAVVVSAAGAGTRRRLHVRALINEAHILARSTRPGFPG